MSTVGAFAENLVAIDGSKFKAVNHRDRNFTSAKLKRRMDEIESSIARCLKALDTADREEPMPSGPKGGGLEEKIAKLKAQMKELQAIEKQLEASPDKQISLTDPDARSMITSGNGIVGYNVQTAVDTKHHLIVAHEVTNVGQDRDQLSSIVLHAQTMDGCDTLFDPTTCQGEHRNELECAHLQLEASDENPRHAESDESAGGLKSLLFARWTS
ncbi:hypothetical protein PS862_04558 [Pseudomonas fluorescens]|uniref:Transposase n=1 Tax=Pseudomonas fluorescens TaxID=294 RepID=A0A5E7NCR5_PSEFL|nr:hypothetical protein PS862_04558 [Pseudomonas fluorescens]